MVEFPAFCCSGLHFLSAESKTYCFSFFCFSQPLQNFCLSLGQSHQRWSTLPPINDVNTGLHGEELTINRKAGRGASAAVWKGVELAGVARLVYCPDLLDGQLSFPEATAQTDPRAEVISDPVLALVPVEGHSGAVALLGCLLPQHLAHPGGEAVPAGQGGRLPAHHRLIALYRSFT